MAAGVPNPAAPSMNEPNSQATMTTWTRRSSLTPWKERRIADTPPDRSSVCSRRRAPKMMNRRSKVRKSPWIDAAATRVGDILPGPQSHDGGRHVGGGHRVLGWNPEAHEERAAQGDGDEGEEGLNAETQATSGPIRRGLPPRRRGRPCQGVPAANTLANSLGR